MSIRLDPANATQTFNTEQTGDILALAVSPDRKIVATSSLGAKPLVVVYDAEVRRLAGWLAAMGVQPASQPASRSIDRSIDLERSISIDRSISSDRSSGAWRVAVDGGGEGGARGVLGE